MRKGIKYIIAGVCALGLSTLVAQDLVSVRSLNIPKMWGMGVNVRHFGYDAALMMEQPGLRAVKTQQL
jgi:hypothetical protein